MSASLRILPLGGLGEIGMNSLAVEAGGDLVVIDAGVMFPDRELGVDVVHPDFAWLEQRRARVRALVLTHGHEDHIGAVPYLLRCVDAPVYGPPYTLALVRMRLAEHGMEADLRPTAPRRPFAVGPFEIEPVRVTHSIADACALVVRTPAGTVVHTGDFKIDPSPGDGETFDEARLREVGDEGVRLLLSDSTGALTPGWTGSEADAARELDALVGTARERVIVSLFASNVHRVRSMLAIARAHGRRVCLLGRSLSRHVEVAVETGYLRDPSATLVPPEEARDVPRGQLLVLATGTQGEQAAALARLASGQHPALDLAAGDLVILSSRVIPGNDLSVNRVLDALSRRGVELRFRATDPGVHVSGHAYAGEQRRMLELVRPRAFVPVHGTHLHLARHAELARAMGVEQTQVIENGQLLEVREDGLRLGERVEVPRVHVDAGEEIPPGVLRDRALLAELGFALVVVRVDRSGRPIGLPDVFTRGVVAEEEEDALVEAARDAVADELRGGRGGRRTRDPGDLEDAARRALKRFLGRRLGRKPLTWGVVVEAGR